MPLKPSVITQTVSKSYQTNEKFLKLEKISLENCLEGTGEIQKIKASEIRAKSLPTIQFGKYKGKTYRWLKENDPHYFAWAEENVEGFGIKAGEHI